MAINDRFTQRDGGSKGTQSQTHNKPKGNDRVRIDPMAPIPIKAVETLTRLGIHPFFHVGDSETKHQPGVRIDRFAPGMPMHLRILRNDSYKLPVIFGLTDVSAVGGVETVHQLPAIERGAKYVVYGHDFSLQGTGPTGYGRWPENRGYILTANNNAGSFTIYQVGAITDPTGYQIPWIVKANSDVIKRTRDGELVLNSFSVSQTWTAFLKEVLTGDLLRMLPVVGDNEERWSRPAPSTWIDSAPKPTGDNGDQEVYGEVLFYNVFAKYGFARIPYGGGYVEARIQEKNIVKTDDYGLKILLPGDHILAESLDIVPVTQGVRAGTANAEDFVLKKIKVL
jgi:hypothetical protein